jgi:hypothetical protein
VRAVGPQQPGERGAAGLPHELVHRRRKGELAAPEETVQQFRHEGMEPMGADPAAGQPQDRGRGGDVRAVRARAPARPRRRPGPRRAAEEADDGLAVDAGDGHDLIQELAFLGPGRVPIALPLDGGILPKAGSRHGSLLGWIGNRDF